VPPVVLTRELLHDADRPHGHEVAREAELVGAVDRQVVDSRFERGSAIAARRLPFARGRGRGVLGNQSRERSAACRSACSKVRMSWAWAPRVDVPIANARAIACQ